MSVNRRKGRYKSAKEFEQESESLENFVSKTQLKKQSLNLKKFGLELTNLKKSVLEKMPIGEVTLRSLLDFQKMTTNLARKRHLMFIGKCLRSENEAEIREYLEKLDRAHISTMKLNEGDSIAESDPEDKSSENQLFERLIDADNDAIELFLKNNHQLERQNLRQLIRNCKSTKVEKKKSQAKEKLMDYLKINAVSI
ncbi:MAG: ribosome biogenesis factor YjgA [Kangiellaceae bacterium]